ncbi:thioredoxin family protein [Mailhella massiliensis]|uniref:Thioredoxin family protein n=1 Tax=Mailhella massiliensis TaxID=1903261 RepID=A0A921AX71_9BACT|nr:thioredoxin family protein [Mailhella massiliensis]HJD97980.1 thioredoxin family protein [Mailhella massiliensis]
MIIRVFGRNCVRCTQTEEIMRQAVADCACSATVENIFDFREMMLAGVLSTPAVSVDGVLRCSGRVPTPEEAREWLAAAEENKG